jgi:hypothetical protein
MQNKIKFIELGTFDKLQSLEHLYLHDNTCLTNGPNAKGKQKVKAAIKVLNTSCGNLSIVNNNFNDSSTTKIPPTTAVITTQSTTAITTTESTTIEQTTEGLDSTSYPSESPLTPPSDPETSKNISLIVILVVFIVICICLVFYIISSNRNKHHNNNNNRNSLLNNYRSLPRRKREFSDPKDENTTEMGQRVTSGIYEDISEYQRSQDDAYQCPFDDSSDYVTETTNIEPNQHELYEKVDDDLYEEIVCDKSKALGNSRTAGLEYDTYNDPEDFYQPALVNTYKCVEPDHEDDDVNRSQDSIKLRELNTTDQCQKSEDFYAETFREEIHKSEHDLYATVRKG